MGTAECGDCGRKARVTTGDYRFDEVGIPVLLKNVELIDCRECGAVSPVIQDMNGLMDVIAFAVIAQPCRLKGAEVRFLRKYLGMDGNEFSKLIEIERTTLSKWENNQTDIGKHSDRLIRFLVVGQSADLRRWMERFMEKYKELTDCEPSRKPQLKIDSETLEYEYA
jgi:DNA-binding transcriptional regulator YiaG